jgi:hypothetical protein
LDLPVSNSEWRLAHPISMMRHYAPLLPSAGAIPLRVRPASIFAEAALVL